MQSERNIDKMEHEEFEAAQGPEEHGDASLESEGDEADVVPTTEPGGDGGDGVDGLFGSDSEAGGSA